MKKEHTHLLRTYFYKLLTSPSFYLSIVGVAAVGWLSLIPDILQSGGSLFGYTFMTLDHFLGISAPRRIVTILGALPFAANFSAEWKSSVSTSIAVRSGVRKYAVSNIICTFVSATVAVFFGLMLFSLSYSLASGNYLHESLGPNPLADPFNGYVYEHDLVFVFITYKALVFAAANGAWAALGLTASAFFPNRYIAICAPIVIDYILERVTFDAPDPIFVAALQTSDIGFKSFWGQLAYSLFFFTAVAAAGGAVFYIIVKRRVQNEFT